MLCPITAKLSGIRKRLKVTQHLFSIIIAVSSVICACLQHYALKLIRSAALP